MILTRCHVMQTGRFLEFPAREGQMHVSHSAGVSMRVCDCPVLLRCPRACLCLGCDEERFCLVGF